MLTQENREITITTSKGDTEIVLRKFRGEESISRPFEFRVEMLSENGNISLESMLGTNATISMLLADGSKRYIQGRWASFRHVNVDKNKVSLYEGLLVPRLWFLELRSDCRIFQNMTAPDIVLQVLKDAEISDVRTSFQKSYPEREYCVQFRETSLNFISRLLEEEGIFYFFEHSETRHTLVLADAPSTVKRCPGQPLARWSQTVQNWADEEGVESLERKASVCTGKITLNDYDFEKPRTSLLVGVGSDLESYDFPGKFVDRNGGDRLSRIRLEEEESRKVVVDGSSRCRAFIPGFRFKLEDHFRADSNIEYTLVKVEHEAAANNHRASDQNELPYSYSNRFEAIPHSSPFRPARTARRPFVQGVQTALVVGKQGEDIWVDKHGRVKIQFFWDREGRKDENSSCWVRVSQAWAGRNWGAISLPRIGQEVIVSFLDGDLDRPIITGRVFNGENMPPYVLPANQTQSGIKSRSANGGGASNYNEIRLEDKKGSEMITVHAEKDMETEVEGTRTETITKDSVIKIKQGNSFTHIELGKSTTEAMHSIELRVGPSSIKIDSSGVTIQGPVIKIKGDATVQLKSPVTEVTGDGLLILKGGVTQQS